MSDGETEDPRAKESFCISPCNKLPHENLDMLLVSWVGDGENDDHKARVAGKQWETTAFCIAGFPAHRGEDVRCMWLSFFLGQFCCRRHDPGVGSEESKSLKLQRNLS